MACFSGSHKAKYNTKEVYDKDNDSYSHVSSKTATKDNNFTAAKKRHAPNHSVGPAVYSLPAANARDGMYISGSVIAPVSIALSTAGNCRGDVSPVGRGRKKNTGADAD
ncbi:hypothetical protein ElyMa_006284800 [Elysia marginata]|uniref:Uncharacterized protein n=1 Tax=Elysia marginata TaxID=1093978 RepID=A0AAV4HDW5_9GAST|nr:hypothetical protein ElyMa_006284800 [Elysia marginata]